MADSTLYEQFVKYARYDGPGRIVVSRILRPACPPDGVLVKVHSSGICGSDLVVFSGAREQPSNSPGHEFSGTIVEIGEAVSDFLVGEAVCAESFSHCGRCEACIGGTYNLCRQRVFMPGAGPAGFSEIAVVPASSLHRLPAGVDFELGALVEPLAVGYHALDRIVERPVHRLLVIGAGTIGLSTLLCAKAGGVEEVWIVAKHPHQIELAKRFGATEILEPPRYLAEGLPCRPDAVVCTSTSGEALSQAIRYCRPRGTIVVTSAYTVETSVQLRAMIPEELYMVGSIAYAQNGPKSDFDVVIDWLAGRVLEPRALITHRFGLDDIAEAYRVAGDKSEKSVKVQIQMLP